MGLDMYLYAERSFVVVSNEAEAVLAAAGVSLDRLVAMSNADPMEHETEMYLGRWAYMKDHDGGAEYERTTRILELAELLPAFDHDEANSGRLGYRDGSIVVSLNAAYWRKANAIHAWFVDNCQAGVDECQLSDPIDVEQLAHLRSLCLDALAAYKDGDLNKAYEIMTPRPGFFFGAYEIDEWWAQDMAATALDMERVITAAIKVQGITFRYHSSW